MHRAGESPVNRAESFCQSPKQFLVYCKIVVSVAAKQKSLVAGDFLYHANPGKPWPAIRTRLSIGHFLIRLIYLSYNATTKKEGTSQFITQGVQKYLPVKQTMGSGESKEKMYCTRYMNGDGPPPLAEQVENSINGTSTLKRGSQIVEGNQPDGGHMTMMVQRRSVEGYPDYDTLQINFVFEDGIQTEKHPNPGKAYYGLSTAAYLPMNNEGTKVYRLLEAAFQNKLLFTVETNSTGDEQVTYTDIPLKTSESGGPESFGYPDPNYLKTVTKLLKSKGFK
ncbi:hypothetical protein NFI96_019776 [Prochilodus magdalenae]|nr:hypothetical protein NFI96_019776 [Prochilodus magdalenae]